MNPTANPAADKVAVRVEGLSVRRGRTLILDDVSCTIPAGACTAILGPNGSGKTTLTRTFIGQMFKTAGTVTVLGQTIGRTDIRTLRRRVGVVNPTVDTGGAHMAGAVVDADLCARDAVLTGFFGTVGLYDSPTDEQREQAAHSLEQVGLADRADLRFALLSTGEKRRCMIARALVAQPEMLILDEPTAGLDIAGREQVLATVDMILARPDPPTVLMITHHVEELSPRTAQVILMNNGHITATGPPQKIITPESLTETFGCKVFVKKLHGRYWLEVLPEAWVDLTKGDGERHEGTEARRHEGT